MLIDYRLRGVTRTRLPDDRWRTTVVIERRGDGWMPVEIGDRDTIYARATGQPRIERVEFTTARRPARLMLDPRGRTHDWNTLNNRERRGVMGRATWEWKLDNPSRDVVRRDRMVSAWMPVVWSNNFGGVTLGLRQRSNYFGSYNRSVLIGSLATRGGAAERGGVYLRITNPLGEPSPRLRRTFTAWSVEGRAGVAIEFDRSLRRHLSFGADPHVAFDAVWMTTTNRGYLDARLWDNAGSIEAGPRIATTIERGATVFHATMGDMGGWHTGIPVRGRRSRGTRSRGSRASRAKPACAHRPGSAPAAGSACSGARI